MGKHADKILKVAVSSPCPITDIKGKTIVFYRVNALFQNEENGPYVIVNHRRFNDFLGLHESLQDHFSTDHIKNMLPEPPMKAIPLFTNHTSPEFMEKRKNELSNYLKEVIKIPRVGKATAMLGFLGWYPRDIRETSLVFKSSLQVKMKDTKGKGEVPCKVHAFLPDKKGRPGAAEESGEVQKNDLICRVNGEMTGGSSFSDVDSLIKESPRPIIIHFLGVNPYTKPSSDKTKKSDSSEDDDEDEEDEEDDSSGSESDSAAKKKKKKSAPKKGKRSSSDSDDSDDGSDEEIPSDSDSSDSYPKKSSKKNKKDGKRHHHH